MHISHGECLHSPCEKKEFYACSQKTKVETCLVSHMNGCCLVGCTCKKKNDSFIEHLPQDCLIILYGLLDVVCDMQQSFYESMTLNYHT